MTLRCLGQCSYHWGTGARAHLSFSVINLSIYIQKTSDMYCEFFCLSFMFKNGLYYLQISLKGMLVWQVHEALSQHHLPTSTADLNSSLCCWGTVERCPDRPIMSNPIALSLQFVTRSANTALTPWLLAIPYYVYHAEPGVVTTKIRPTPGHL